MGIVHANANNSASARFLPSGSKGEGLVQTWSCCGMLISIRTQSAEEEEEEEEVLKVTLITCFDSYSCSFYVILFSAQQPNGMQFISTKINTFIATRALEAEKKINQ